MSPDMKRLVEAAYKAALKVGIYPVIDAEAEAIVRAVLTELREVSAEIAEAGRWPAEDDGPVACIRAMVDAILTEPAIA